MSEYTGSEKMTLKLHVLIIDYIQAMQKRTTNTNLKLKQHLCLSICKLFSVITTENQVVGEHLSNYFDT